MKKIKKAGYSVWIFTLVLSIVLSGVLNCGAVSQPGDTAIDVIDFNNYDENGNYIGPASDFSGKLEWSLSDGTLTISGSGKMPDYSNTEAPWYSSRSSIKKAVIEKGVTSISGLAFLECSNMASISLPSTLESIGAGAFFKCEKLSAVKIPKATVYIGWYPFAYCTSLKSIEIEKGNPNYISSDGVLFSSSKETLVQYPVGKSGTSYAVPACVDEVGMGAFAGSRILKNISFAKNARYVENYVFIDCSVLENVALGRRIEVIAEDAFSGCKKLKNIYFEGSYYDWASIEIESGNSPVLSAKIVYNSSGSDMPSSPGEPEPAEPGDSKSVTVDYRSTVHILLGIPSLGLPSGYTITLYDGNNMVAKGNNKELKYDAKELTSDKSYVFKFFDAGGNRITQYNGLDLNGHVNIHVKDGFFDRFIAFFLGILGILPEYEWELIY